MIAISGYASHAVARAWHVFPCRPGDKRPMTGRWEQRATADPAEAAQIWERCPDANIGIACGPSGLVVLDLDCHGELPLPWRDEPGVTDGKDVAAALAERAGQLWPTTHMVATPSGGWHLYYLAPAGAGIRNSAGKLGPLIDVRASGGYVVGAGSVTDVGTYEILSDPDEPVEPLPAWLLSLLTAPVSEMSECPNGIASTPGLHSPRYAQAALEGELANVISAAEGIRNVTLNNAALKLGQLCVARQLDSAEVTMLLTDAALAAGLPAGEVRATIASGMRAARPRSLL